jgi:hypothetical protein
MCAELHAEGTEHERISLIGLAFLFVDLVAAFVDGLVGVEAVEFCKSGVGEEQKLESAGEGGHVLFTSVELSANVVCGQLVEVSFGEGEIAKFVWWMCHDNKNYMASTHYSPADK